MYCKNCGAKILSGAKFCSDCGVLVGNGDYFCAECGAEVGEARNFCPKCGSSLSDEDVVLIKSDKPIVNTETKIKVENKEQNKNNSATTHGEPIDKYTIIKIRVLRIIFLIWVIIIAIVAFESL